MRIGVAGVGRMGGAIAAHLMEVGHEVTVPGAVPHQSRSTVTSCGRETRVSRGWDPLACCAFAASS